MNKTNNSRTQRKVETKGCCNDIYQPYGYIKPSFIEKKSATQNYF